MIFRPLNVVWLASELYTMYTAPAPSALYTLMYYSDFRWRTCSACQSRWCAYIRVLKDMCIVWARGHYSRCFGGYGRKWGGIVWVKEGDSARGYVTVCIYIHLYAGLSACAVFKIDNILFSLWTMNGWWQNGVIHYCFAVVAAGRTQCWNQQCAERAQYEFACARLCRYESDQDGVGG